METTWTGTVRCRSVDRGVVVDEASFPLEEEEGACSALAAVGSHRSREDTWTRGNWGEGTSWEVAGGTARDRGKWGWTQADRASAWRVQ